MIQHDDIPESIHDQHVGFVDILDSRARAKPKIERSNVCPCVCYSMCETRIHDGIARRNQKHGGAKQQPAARLQRRLDVETLVVAVEIVVEIRRQDLIDQIALVADDEEDELKQTEDERLETW